MRYFLVSSLLLILLGLTMAPSRAAEKNQETQPTAARVLVEAEVVVYGGTPCGIVTAIAAAREGASVLLLEPTGHIGGLSTSGINTAETEHMLKWTIGGIALEFYERLGKHYGTGKPEFFFESSVAELVYHEMLKEAGVHLIIGAPVSEVSMERGRLVSATFVGPEGTRVFHGKVFVDASYEGDLMALAGVKFAVGRESKAEYGEEAAGIRFDKIPRHARTLDEQGHLLPGISGWTKDLKEGDAHPGVMNYNFRLTLAKDPALRMPLPVPSHYDAGRYTLFAGWLQEKAGRKEAVKLADLLDFYARRNGKYELNNKQASIISLGNFGQQFPWPTASAEERRKIYDDHLDYTLGLLHFLATDERVPENVRAGMSEWGLHKDEFTDNHNLPYQLYVREGRRMRGAYVVTQHDVQEDRRKPDAIGISSHFIDCHHIQRLAVSDHEFVNEGRIWRMGYAWQIPYRALTPQPGQCVNLLVPGAASLSHVAFCTYRLESVWMIAGHAAGVAASMAAKASIPVQEVDVPQLQEKLRAQKQVVDFIPGQLEKNDQLNGPPEV